VWANLIINDMYKVTREDYFVWMVIPTSQAKTTDREVFILHGDDSETLVTDFNNLDNSNVYGVELEFIDNITDRYILKAILMENIGYHDMDTLWWLVGAELKEIQDYIKVCIDNELI
jgi:hypothetical protein